MRSAYRELARRHHPDVAGSAGGDTIHAVNEAYRVLGDPGRRVLYDRSLAEPVRAEPAPPERPPPTVAPHPPARFPWRGLAVATALAVVVVVAASLFVEPAPPPPPDGILRPGSCVTIEPNGDAREAACRPTDDAAGDIVVEVVVPFGAACPFGTAPHRDHQGQGTACLVFPVGRR